jgi:hypothetical protein
MYVVGTTRKKYWNIVKAERVSDLGECEPVRLTLVGCLETQVQGLRNGGEERSKGELVNNMREVHYCRGS